MLVVVSIGGSVFSSWEIFKKYAEVIEMLKDEHELFVVVGGGKTAREYIQMARSLGASEGVCDRIGIEITRIHARLLISALGDCAYPVPPEDYEGARLASLTGKVVVMGGVSPGYTTDAVSAILADYVKADLLVSLTSTDGVYEKDPEMYPDARKFDSLTYKELLDIVTETELKAGSKGPFDPVGVKIAERSSISMVIADGRKPENLARIINGEKVGTFVGTVAVR
jgi:uridylate kinase